MARRTPGPSMIARYIVSRRPKASTSMRPADGELDRVFERAMLLHRRQRELEVAVDHLAFFQCPAPEFTLFRPPAPERQHHRQGDLSLAEIVADILAELGRRAAIVERVVDKLKGNAKIGAVTLAGGDL